MPQLTDEQRQASLSLLQDLIRIDSTNTTQADSNARRAEERIIQFVSRVCVEMGMEVSLHEVFPGRCNLTAHWPEQKAFTSIALEAHTDTVGVGGMTIDPFAADVGDGKVWGRGACDDKGSLAAFLSALRIARARGRRFADKIHLVATVGEETGCEGAYALADSGFRVDACVVGEPTNCRLVTAHKGALWFRVTAEGVPSHTSVPERGRNAIHAMGRVIRFVEEDFSRRLAGECHPLVGAPTIAVSMISGGQAVNVVPPRCEANVDWRFLPGQDVSTLAAEFERSLRAALPDDADALTVTDVRGHPAVESDPDGPLVRNLLGSCRAVTGQDAPAGVNYFTDSGPLSQARIQCVVFGPGDIANAHGAAEFLELEQFYLAIETVLDWLENHADRSLLG